MDPISVIIYIVILLYSVILHEVAHGLMAERLGDPTARYSGRLTLNPIPHIDPIGSILLPLLLWFGTAGRFVIGAAKPVPVDYRNFSNFRRDMALVALSGPLMNLLIAFVFAAAFRLIPNASAFVHNLFLQAMVLNIVLAVFNLIPIPPLDGSKVLASLFGFLNRRWMYNLLEFERFGFIIVLLFMFTGLLQRILIPPVDLLLRLFLGPQATGLF
ncbi:MAG: site-2 protease family protein [Candidatus Saccharibacteria bacterium]